MVTKAAQAFRLRHPTNRTNLRAVLRPLPTSLTHGCDSSRSKPGANAPYKRPRSLTFEATNDLYEERSGTDIAGPEHIGQRRSQKEGNQNPRDEEIKEHGAVSLPIFNNEAHDS